MALACGTFSTASPAPLHALRWRFEGRFWPYRAAPVGRVQGAGSAIDEQRNATTMLPLVNGEPAAAPHGERTAGLSTAAGGRRRRPARRDTSLRSLATGMVLVLATWFSAAAALPGLRAELSLTAAEERWAVVAVQIGFAVAAAGTALAGLADRFAPRRLAVLGALLAAAANIVPVACPSWTVLVASRAVVGGALALVYPPLLKAACSWARGDQGRVLGMMIAALTLGSASPHLVNGLGPVSWRAMLWTTSLTATAGAALVWFRAADGPGAPSPSRVTVDDIAAVMRSRPLRLTCLGYVGHVWELYAGWAALAPLMLALWDDTRTASLGTFAVVAVGAVAAAGGGRLGDRVGRRQTATAAMALSASLVALLGFATPWPIVASAIALAWGAAVIADGGQFPALVSDHADHTLVGSVLSLQLALGFAATSAATWLVPLVADAAGWRWALACLAPGPALGALALHRLGAAARPTLGPTRLARSF